MENRYEAEFEMPNDPVTMALLNAIKNSPPRTQILNMGRYCEMMVAKAAFDHLLKQSFDAGTSFIKMHPQASSACLVAEVDSMEVSDMQAFAIVMAKADVFEIVPLTSGKVHIAFTFSHMMITIEEG